MPDTPLKDAEREEAVLRRAVASLRETGRPDMTFWAEALEEELAEIPWEARAFGERLHLRNLSVRCVIVNGCRLPNARAVWILLGRLVLAANLREWAQRIFTGQPDWREFAYVFDREGD